MKKYKNIIFDLGGVILTIDYTKTIEAFRNLGIQESNLLYSKANQTSLFDDLEKGKITDQEFFTAIRSITKIGVSDDQIRDAWNALLIGLPDENFRLLKELKKDHRLFLLSNTNSIHEKAYRKMIIDQYGTFIFDDLFEKMYLSHKIHMRKPDAEIFQYVLADSQLDINDTCFIDDSPQHVEGAHSVNLPAFHLIDNLVNFANSLIS